MRALLLILDTMTLMEVTNPAQSIFFSILVLDVLALNVLVLRLLHRQ